MKIKCGLDKRCCFKQRQTGKSYSSGDNIISGTDMEYFVPKITLKLLHKFIYAVSW